MAEELIHEAFDQQVLAQPDAIALSFHGHHDSYRTLDLAARAFAGELAACGVGPGNVVPVALPRSPRLVAVLLAILNRGAAYAVCDPHWPVDRLRAVVQLSGSPVCVADLPGPAGFASLPLSVPPSGALENWYLPSIRPETTAESARVTPDAAATVFFTSGTTGVPKGVLSPHRAITRLFVPGGPLAFGPGTVMAQVAPASWDAFSLELWGMLTTGGTCTIVADNYLLPNTLSGLVATDGVNVIWLTASLFNLFVERDIDCFEGIGTVYAGGERLSPQHVRRFLQRFPATSLVNGYGPVESCVFATTHPIVLADCQRANGIPLGRAVPGTQVFIRDGEICIAGAGLALGYLGDTELTAAKFTDEYIDGMTVRLYHTGDLGSLDADGLLHFHGRADRQVKIRGYRLELDEIETAASGLAGIVGCVVAPVPGRVPGVFDKLALFYKRPAGSTPEPDPHDIRRRLAAVLPSYAIPDVIQAIDQLPVTANGKTNVTKLLSLIDYSGHLRWSLRF